MGGERRESVLGAGFAGHRQEGLGPPSAIHSRMAFPPVQTGVLKV